MGKRIAITLGDPAGIGPEVLVKALASLSKSIRKSILVIGSDFVLTKTLGYKQLKKDFELIDLDNINKKDFCFGIETASSGRASLDYLDKALALAKAGEINAIVTGPVSKYVINLSVADFRGQTEYISHALQAKLSRMMILSGKLKFSLVTTHLALIQACQALNIANILQTIELTALEVKRLFIKEKPIIGVCGLNPHLGEAGLLGKEEGQIISPAISQAQRKISYALIRGPLILEQAVNFLRTDKLDVVVCLYHDQAILPIKLLCPGKGVNLTLGLPIVRTSPLHGTAFDIAGKNKANPASLLEAIKLTLQLARRRLN